MNDGHVVGLTGGIASGKSTVASIFEKLGIPCIDADRVARDVVAPGSLILKQVIAEFGTRYLLPDGTLDRKALADMVFASPSKRAALNAIVHPAIAEQSGKCIKNAQKNNPPYVIYNAALLIENGLQDDFDALVLVKASPQTQAERLAARDGLSAQEIQQRLTAQKPFTEKLAFADYVIDNNGDMAATQHNTEEVHRALVARFAGIHS